MFNIGDKVRVTKDSGSHGYRPGDTNVVSGIFVTSVGNFVHFEGDPWGPNVPFTDIVLVEDKPQQPQDKVASDGGPSDYYDLPYKDWVTVNDQMEYLAEHKWGKFGIHLKDIFKGLCRWGDKQNTTVEYDTNKIIYYGLRVKLMLCGKQGVQDYLKKLANDPQFKV